MTTLTRTTEWEGEFARLVKLEGLPTRDGGYKMRKGSGRISRVIVHQSAGNFLAGERAALAIARFHTADPIYETDSDGTVRRRSNGRFAWIGGGRGWPGIGYTFVVPGLPELVDGKIEVFRVNEDDRHTYHTGSPSNRVGVAVCFGGTFASRHLRDGKLTRPRPGADAIAAGHDLIMNYLLPRYDIEPVHGLFGHFDLGKPACPGDWLEQWVRYQRGEPVKNPLRWETEPPADDYAPRFATIAERQRALVTLGFDIGTFGRGQDGVDGVWGEASKGALLAFQDATGLVVNGRWGPRTEEAVGLALDRQGRGEKPF
jgi:hypothetical protein